MTFPALVDIPYDTRTLLLIAVIVVGTTALSAIAGFGFGTIAAPTLLFLLPPPAVVVIIKVTGTGTIWVVLLSIWRRIRWRTIVKILPAAFAGLLVGGYILKEADPAAIQLFAGVLVLISALTLIARPILIENDALWSTSLVGFLTGVMGNATGLLAPAVVVYFTGRQFPRDVFRATTLTLFLTIDMIGLPTLALQGAVSWGDMQFALLLMPLAIAGRMLGLRLAPFVPQRHFRNMTIGLLFVMAVLSIATAGRDLVS